MKKIAVQNLAMIITSDCNLNCGHCLRGTKCSSKMKDEVISATLDQILMIGNLCICGGEPLLALDVLEKIFNYIIDHKIMVDEVSLVTNGTIYSTEFLLLLKEIDDYISLYQKTECSVHFNISEDQYHKAERRRLNLEKKYIENCLKYQESKYFNTFNTLDPKLKLFREGNAVNLDSSLTVPLKQTRYILTYAGSPKKQDLENGFCNIGPLVAINQEGIMTECDGSEINQHTIYNYGNVLNTSIEYIALMYGKVVKPSKWNRETKKAILKRLTYNK